MSIPKKPIWLAMAALIFLSLAAYGCGGKKQTATPEPEPESCSGDLYVESETVTRVTPAPNVTYADNSTHTWSEPPYGVEVTGNGEAVLRVYFGSDLLSEYRAFAAGVESHAQFTVEKWNGAKDVTLNVGNYVITDTDEGDVCELNVSAAQVGISSVATKYVVTVRPEIDQVVVAVLEGVVEVTSLGQVVTLDAKMPSAAMVVISEGIFGPLLPIPDPGKLLEEIQLGQDVQFAPLGPDSLTLWADERLLPVLEEIGAQFEADTGIKVLIESMPLFDIYERYHTALQDGSAPDLVTLQHQQIYELIANGYILPVGMRIDPGLLIPGTIQAFSYKGEMYGVPYVYDNLALVSNSEYLTEIPPTWSQLRSYTAELSAGRDLFTSLLIPATGYHFYPIQSAFGGYIFGTFEDGTFNAEDFGMSSEGSLEAAAWFGEMVDTQPVFSGDEEEALKNFQARSAAMIVTGPWALQRLREMGVPFWVNSFPGELEVSKPFLSVYGFLISRGSQAQEAAQNLVWNYLTSYQAVSSYARLTSAPPARRDALENLEDADLRLFGFAGEHGVPIPFIPEMNNVWGPWRDAILSIISGEMSGYDAFTNAHDIILKDMGR